MIFVVRCAPSKLTLTWLNWLLLLAAVPLPSCRPTAAGNATGLVCIIGVTREDDFPHCFGLCGTIWVDPNPLRGANDRLAIVGGLCHVVARDFDPSLVMMMKEPFSRQLRLDINKACTVLIYCIY
jgi:hypothetical protein